MIFRVTENETGSSATTDTTYYLTTTLSFPQGANPYYGTFTGDLIVTDDDAEVSTAVGWFNLIGFTVEDAGNGKVNITSPGAGADTDAIHDNVAGEIAALPLVTAAGGDHVLIEDVSDSNNKKRVLASDFFSGGTDATLPIAGVIGTPTNNTMQEKDDAHGGVGIVSGGGITDDTDGTITVAAGTGFIRATNSDTAALLSFDFAAEAGANVTLTDDDLNYIYIEYNAGSPRTIATTTERTDYNTNIFLGTVYRDGTTLHITQIPIYTGNVNRQAYRFHVETDGLKRASGSIISATGTRNFAITSGVWWVGMDRFTIAAIDTSAAGTFTYYYRDGVGGWTAIAGQTQINNTNYDDGDGILGVLGGTDYGVHWVYRGVDGDCYVLYGRDNYTSGQAAAATPPTDVPGHFEGYHVALVGKIVIREGDAAFHTIETPFTTVFTSSGVVNHDELAGLANDDHTQYATTAGARDAILDSEISPAEGFIRKTGAGAYTAHKSQLAGTAAPTVNEDSGDGYSVGSLWIDTTNDKTYRCVDSTLGAAVWKQTSNEAGGGDVVGPASSTDNAVARFDSTTGKLLQDSANSTLGDNSDLALNGTSAGVTLAERASLSDPGAGKGTFGVKNVTPARAVFQNDTNAEIPLGERVHFAFCNRMATTGANSYIGNSGAAPYDYTGYNDTRTGAQGSPETPNYPSGLFCVPFTGKVVKIVGWVSIGNVSTDDFDLELWKWTPVDDSPATSCTGTELCGTNGFYHGLNDVSAGGDWAPISLAPTSSNDVTEGDLLELLYYNVDTTSGTVNWSITVTVERTA
jgi:hypothetical protein